MHVRPPLRARCAAAMMTVIIVGGCAGEGPDQRHDTEPPSAADTSGGAERPPTSLSSTAWTPPRSTPPPSPPPTPRRTAPPSTPPFIASATWADSDYGITLAVAPTTAGRHAWGPHDAEAAWQEVLRLAPDADTPGMWEQFDCHWTWARLLEPHKPTWNLEPWRPVVPPERMLAEGCNPGGPEV